MFTRSSILLCAAAAALAFTPLGASALNFTVNQYSKSDLTSAQTDFAALIGSDWKFATTEDFERFGDDNSSDFVGVKQIGADSTNSLTTAVGKFTTLTDSTDSDNSDIGSGNTAIGTSGTKNDADRGRNLSLRQNGDAPNNGGRQNTSDGAGDDTYLDSNDTLGMKWTAGVTDGNGNLRFFDRLLFTLTDPSDQGKRLTISADGFTRTHDILPTQNNGEIFNVLIAFSNQVSSAEIFLEKSGINDGFSIDNATVGAVPLPAAVWLLMFASGGLITAKRRSAVRA